MSYDPVDPVDVVTAPTYAVERLKRAIAAYTPAERKIPAVAEKIAEVENLLKLVQTWAASLLR